MADKSHTPEILRLTELLDKTPESRLFVPLAETYLASEQVDEAIQVLSEGIKFHPMFVAARVMLGKVYLEKGAIAEAKEQFEQVIEVAPYNIPSLKGLAAVFRNEGRQDEVKTLYTKILEIDPTDRAAIAFFEGAEDQAVDDNTAASGVESHDQQEPVFNSAEENKSAVEVHPDAVADAGQEEPHLTQTMAALYISQGLVQEAVEIYEKLLKQNPDDQASQLGLEAALQSLHGNEAEKEDQKTLSVEKKIERLQAWLETIQKNKRQ